MRAERKVVAWEVPDAAPDRPLPSFSVPEQGLEASRLSMPCAPLPRLGIRWTFTSFTGWGVFGLNLARDLTRRGLAVPVPLYTEDLLGDEARADPALAPALAAQREIRRRLETGDPLHLDFPVLHGLGNGLSAGQLSAGVFGAPDIGMVFLEDTRQGNSVAQAARYRLLLAGSAWNGEVLRSFGIEHVAVCPQGVDTTLFRPQPRRGVFGDRFTIFSGGKLEFRKGQDIIVAAFRIFHARHPDALLLTAWSSPFPGAAADLAQSPHGTGAPVAADSLELVSHWLARNGVPLDSMALLPAISNEAMASWLGDVDAAVFVSRAEGGTNLAAMETLACGVPTILSANTGHLDLIASVPCVALERQSAISTNPAAAGQVGWGETDPMDVVDALEQLYARREEARAMGRDTAAAMASTWSWSRRIDGMLSALAEVGAWPRT